MQNLDEFKSLLASPKKIVITTHHKPDADALGSSLGWAGYLQQLGHQVNVITPSDYPRFLNWMSGESDVINYEGHEAQSAQLIADADLVCCLDFSALSRINEMGELVRASKARKLLIDHHLSPEDFADFVFWDTKAAATAELVYDLIVLLGDKALITIPMAECLYAGIMTDTGSFRHSSTTKKVHEVVSELIELGIVPSRIHKLIYDNHTEQRLRFLGYALSEKLRVLPEYGVAYFAITRDELKRFDSQTGDTEGLVNYALSIEGIVMGVLMIDRSEMVKISFRSVGDFSVNAFAREHFDGGGHKNAAGGKSHLSLDETEQKLLALLPQYREQLLACNNESSY
ncbi:phosphoesterase RecJ domain-containing protein [Flexibacter flexilis DSM 6793]|uniref:Phosphoesterase RecJ domain-containing protein n=1 Tax=Flexibacter flexilis DSM 6793 TaxID=927664 RepID=A0A1I1GRB5_9BACT|nr:bifunctional oligoribonuclease/PAP phosphatase NrnA [Flexibacter flexilis]SFC14317.1 phosphoesterase RecJ domain-containing protein [Flexibacter flexilis DSM 6793]